MPPVTLLVLALFGQYNYVTQCTSLKYTWNSDSCQIANHTNGQPSQSQSCPRNDSLSGRVTSAVTD
eukprot:3966150-Pyramimonas_sp.AAC.1